METHIEWCIDNALKQSTDKERYVFFKKHMVINPETRGLMSIKGDNPFINIRNSMLRGKELENWIRGFKVD